MRTIKLAAVILFIFSINSKAQDRFFARTYTSNVLPKGAVDIEFWHTSRMGHEGHFFHAQVQRIELEFGLGNNIQTSVYFNRYQTRFSETADGTTVSNELGFSNEWKWKLSDPSANKIGFAIYGEWGVKGGDELEFETKLILDKYVGKNLFAFNGVFEFEKEFEWNGNKLDAGGWEAPVEFDLGYQYFVKPTLGIGFEIRNHNEMVPGNGWEHSVIFGGPTVNFRNNKWFIIVNYQPQWGNVRKTDTAPFSKVLDKHERAEARIIVGISL